MINVTGYVYVIKVKNNEGRDVVVRCFTDEGVATSYAIAVGGTVDVIAID